MVQFSLKSDGSSLLRDKAIPEEVFFLSGKAKDVIFSEGVLDKRKNFANN